VLEVYALETGELRIGPSLHPTFTDVLEDRAELVLGVSKSGRH
jgi:hypothetical protein